MSKNLSYPILGKKNANTSNFFVKSTRPKPAFSLPQKPQPEKFNVTGL
jgi:hypothetical protein